MITALVLTAALALEPGAPPIEEGMHAYPWIETVANMGGFMGPASTSLTFYRVGQDWQKPDTGITPYWMVRFDKVWTGPATPTSPILRHRTAVWIDQRQCPEADEAMRIINADLPFDAYASSGSGHPIPMFGPHGSVWTLSRYGASGEGELKTVQTDRTGRVLHQRLKAAEDALLVCVDAGRPIVPGTGSPTSQAQ